MDNIKKKRPSLGVTYQLTIISVAFFTFFMLGYIWLTNLWGQAEEEASKLKYSFLEEKKENLKHLNERIFDIIDYELSHQNKKIEQNLLDRVNEAWDIANTLYSENENSKEQAKRYIKETLRNIRFLGSNKHFYINDKKGNSVLYPEKSLVESNNLLSIIDTRGNYTVSDEIELIKKQGEGFIESFWYKADDSSGVIFKKLSFIKEFKPFGWYIGLGEFLIDFETELKKNQLNYFNNMPIEKNSFLFIIDVPDNKIISDCNNIPLIISDISKIDSYRRNDKGFFITDKPGVIAYVRYNKNFNWLIGCGFTLKELDHVINLRRIQLEASVTEQTREMVIVFLIVFAIVLILINYFIKKIQTGVKVFTESFQDWEKNLSQIDKENLYFKEFNIIADRANRMVKARLEAEEEQKLKDRLKGALEMAGAACHELNQPLQIIIGYSEMMLDEYKDDPKMKKRLMIIFESSRKLGKITGKIMNVTRYKTVEYLEGKKIIDIESAAKEEDK